MLAQPNRLLVFANVSLGLLALGLNAVLFVCMPARAVAPAVTFTGRVHRPGLVQALTSGRGTLTQAVRTAGLIQPDHDYSLVVIWRDAAGQTQTQGRDLLRLRARMEPELPLFGGETVEVRDVGW